MYEKGAGLKKNDEEAFRLYLQAATQGHERASVILEAEKWTIYKKKHLSGNEIIHTEITYRHQETEPEARATPQEHAFDAVPSGSDGRLQKYLAKAQAGDMDAQYNLGIMFYHGEGVERDHEEALKWFHLAAEQNDPEAQYNLGFMYGRGEGAAKNHRMSMEWFSEGRFPGP
jgi:TPR repeat protein